MGWLCLQIEVTSVVCQFSKETPTKYYDGLALPSNTCEELCPNLVGNSTQSILMGWLCLQMYVKSFVCQLTKEFPTTYYDGLALPSNPCEKFCVPI